jgi:hypothetical protein
VTDVPRATRFQIATRVLWRPQGTSGWIEALSVNVSRSGVLFQSPLHGPAEIGTEVEFIFAFSWEAADALDIADVRCRGRIVRTVSSSSSGASAMLAAAIETYSFMVAP